MQAISDDDKDPVEPLVSFYEDVSHVSFDDMDNIQIINSLELDIDRLQNVEKCINNLKDKVASLSQSALYHDNVRLKHELMLLRKDKKSLSYERDLLKKQGQVRHFDCCFKARCSTVNALILVIFNS
jgi:hypothetical protein